MGSIQMAKAMCASVCSLLTVSLAGAALAAGNTFVPDFKIKADDYTVLMAAKCKVTLAL